MRLRIPPRPRVTGVGAASPGPLRAGTRHTEALRCSGKSGLGSGLSRVPAPGSSWDLPGHGAGAGEAPGIALVPDIQDPGGAPPLVVGFRGKGTVSEPLLPPPPGPPAPVLAVPVSTELSRKQTRVHPAAGGMPLPVPQAPPARLAHCRRPGARGGAAGVGVQPASGSPAQTRPPLGFQPGLIVPAPDIDFNRG